MMEKIKKLDYEIHSYSSFSTSYLPENITENCPTNQSSRWSSNTNNPPQYLTLKLKRPAVVRQLKFGKYEKAHVCNLKKFRVYGGLEDGKMILLLESGLKNDSHTQTFVLKYTTDNGENYPILFLKIMPLLSWGPSFNFSIWYVEVHGYDDPIYMSMCLKNYNIIRENLIVKLCLKHFREQGYDNAFKSLQEQTNVRLEHPIITDLHEYLVFLGDFKRSESFIGECIDNGLMDGYMSRKDYKHAWNIQSTSSVIRPGTRGGHQLVIDSNRNLIYLYGGWDGFRDLSDLWCFDVENSLWSLIYENSELYNGPSARSCHKMIFDPISNNIFIIGRYLDNNIRTPTYVKSDFYLYDTRNKTWLQICDDTSQVGGPQLIYDHQMCIDCEKRTLYVFGGKVLAPKNVQSQNSAEPEYSGLFSYHIDTNTWMQVLVDCHHPSAANSDVLSIKSRITHCMVFHNKNRKLYIYGGQRGKDEIDDFISYDVDSQMINVLNANKLGHSVEPPAGFTQRATIDCEKDEIYLFSSLSKQKEKRDLQQIDASNSFWVYSLKANEWSKVYTRSQISGQAYNKLTGKGDKQLEPCPRYAHQLIYDEVKKLHYLFGGNPGITDLPQKRLDDFWVLFLRKPSRQETFRYCQYLVRILKYEEITKQDPIYALQFLQTRISEVINHDDPVQLTNFHKLASLLFKKEEDITEGKSQVIAKPIEHKISSHTTDNDNIPKGGDASFYPNNESFNRTNNTTGSEYKSEDISMSTDDSSLQSDDTSTPSTSSVCSPSPIDAYNPKVKIEQLHGYLNSSLGAGSATSSEISADAQLISYQLYKNNGGKKNFEEYNVEVKTRRTFLFNKIVDLMPANMVQPKNNLSDFVLI